jgi:hypothetical protein
MDWLSLTQVKELGVVVQNSAAIGSDATDLFEHWWAWAALSSPPPPPAAPGVAGGAADVSVFVPSLQLDLTVPCWSAAVAAADPPREQCINPLRGSAGLPPPPTFNRTSPMRPSLNGTTAEVFLSGSPPEVLADGGVAAYATQLRGDQQAPPPPSRTWDQDALVETILNASVGGSVSLSVMDYFPSSLYTPPAAAVWWPALNDALITAAVAKGCTVRVLSSKWAHTNAKIGPALAALQTAGASLCPCPAGGGANAPSYMPKCGPNATGSLQVPLLLAPTCWLLAAGCWLLLLLPYSLLRTPLNGPRSLRTLRFESCR